MITDKESKGFFNDLSKLMIESGFIKEKDKPLLDKLFGSINEQDHIILAKILSNIDFKSLSPETSYRKNFLRQITDSLSKSLVPTLSAPEHHYLLPDNATLTYLNYDKAEHGGFIARKQEPIINEIQLKVKDINSKIKGLNLNIYTQINKSFNDIINKINKYFHLEITPETINNFINSEFIILIAYNKKDNQYIYKYCLTDLKQKGYIFNTLNDYTSWIQKLNLLVRQSKNLYDKIITTLNEKKNYNNLYLKVPTNPLIKQLYTTIDNPTNTGEVKNLYKAKTEKTEKGALKELLLITEKGKDLTPTDINLLDILLAQYNETTETTDISINIIFELMNYTDKNHFYKDIKKSITSLKKAELRFLDENGNYIEFDGNNYLNVFIGGNDEIKHGRLKVIWNPYLKDILIINQKFYLMLYEINKNLLKITNNVFAFKIGRYLNFNFAYYHLHTYIHIKQDEKGSYTKLKIKSILEKSGVIKKITNRIKYYDLIQNLIKTLKYLKDIEVITDYEFIDNFDNIVDISYLKPKEILNLKLKYYMVFPKEIKALNQ